jgi:7-cyano-7-deazaguanine synthase
MQPKPHPTKLVLFSGGLDSATLLYANKSNACAILFDYGQRHKIELDYATDFCYKHNIPYIPVAVPRLKSVLASGSQTGDAPVPHGHYADENMKTTIVPNRNAILLSIAVGAAISRNMTEVLYAAHAGDHAIYPDCRPEFFSAFNEAMKLGNAWTPVTLSAPFLSMTKADIVKYGASMEVPFIDTWSCYEGNLDSGVHCGKCGTCVERREAFMLAGVEDPTQYASI